MMKFSKLLFFTFIFILFAWIIMALSESGITTFYLFRNSLILIIITIFFNTYLILNELNNKNK